MARRCKKAFLYAGLLAALVALSSCGPTVLYPGPQKSLEEVATITTSDDNDACMSYSIAAVDRKLGYATTKAVVLPGRRRIYVWRFRPDYYPRGLSASGSGYGGIVLIPIVVGGVLLNEAVYWARCSGKAEFQCILFDAVVEAGHTYRVLKTNTNIYPLRDVETGRKIAKGDVILARGHLFDTRTCRTVLKGLVRSVPWRR